MAPVVCAVTGVLCVLDAGLWCPQCAAPPLCGAHVVPQVWKACGTSEWLLTHWCCAVIVDGCWIEGSKKISLRFEMFYMEIFI